jgi:hypothetical protein
LFSENLNGAKVSIPLRFYKVPGEGCRHFLISVLS